MLQRPAKGGWWKVERKLKIENGKLKIVFFHYAKNRDEKMRNRGQVLDNGAVANCHIKNQPTATSEFVEDIDF